MIVLCSIKEIKRTESQITEIIVSLIKVLAICYSPTEIKASPEYLFGEEEKAGLKDLLRYNVVGQIPKHSVSIYLSLRFMIGKT